MSTFPKPDLSQVDGKSIRFETSGIVKVEETTPSGAAKVEFENPGCSLRIVCPDGSPPIAWLKNQCHADAAVVTEHGGNLDLHVIELKSKLDKKKWSSALKQFEGAAQNAMIVMNFLSMSRPSRIFYYISYSEDLITDKLPKMPLSKKTFVGSKKRISPLDSWGAKTSELDGYSPIVVTTIPRSKTTGCAKAKLKR